MSFEMRMYFQGDSMTHAYDDLVQGLVYCAMERIMIGEITQELWRHMAIIPFCCSTFLTGFCRYPGSNLNFSISHVNYYIHPVTFYHFILDFYTPVLCIGLWVIICFDDVITWNAFRNSGPLCRMAKVKSSVIWYAITLMCCLSDSGMTEMAGFAEMTSDAICPNYSDSDCYTGNASRSWNKNAQIFTPSLTNNLCE